MSIARCEGEEEKKKSSVMFPGRRDRAMSSALLRWRWFLALSSYFGPSRERPHRVKAGMLCIQYRGALLAAILSFFDVRFLRKRSPTFAD